MQRSRRTNYQIRARSALPIGLCLSIVVWLVSSPGAAATFDPAIVVDAEALSSAVGRHNIPNLFVTRGADQFTVNFREFFDRTGGVDRWGFPTSEVMEEVGDKEGLTQYFQRGVIEWHRSNTCGAAGPFCFERRLTWDYIAGGAAGSPDLGAEPGFNNSFDGEDVGTFGHKVSNTAVDGTTVGFQDFFDTWGEQAFGKPKSEARTDDDPRSVLALSMLDPNVSPSVIRQYFEAAVFDYQPGNPVPYLRPLGDDVRDRLYPGQAWKAYRSFHDAALLPAGTAYEIETLIPGPRADRTQVAAFLPITEVCSATAWVPGEPFCTTGFVPARLNQVLSTGDVLRTRPASPGPEMQAIVTQVVDATTRNVQALMAVFGHDSTVTATSTGLDVAMGDAVVAGQPGSGASVTTPGSEGDLTGTLFVVSVHADSGGGLVTTFKVLEGRLSVRARGQPAAQALAVPASQAVKVRTGGVQFVNPPEPLTPDEQHRVDLMHALQANLGQPPGAFPLLTVMPTPPDAVVVNKAALRGTFVIADGGGAPFQWSARPDQSPWLIVTPAEGTVSPDKPQTVSVFANTDLLPGQGAMQANGVIRVTSPTAGSSSVNVTYTP